MKSVDANILLRLVLNDDPIRAEVVSRLLEQASPGELHVADVVFAEMVWVMSGQKYRYSREFIGSSILHIAANSSLRCNRAMLERAVPLYIAHPKISFVDACLSIYAELNHATPLLTFDKPLAQKVSTAKLLV